MMIHHTTNHATFPCTSCDQLLPVEEFVTYYYGHFSNNISISSGSISYICGRCEFAITKCQHVLAHQALVNRAAIVTR